MKNVCVSSYVSLSVLASCKSWTKVTVVIILMLTLSIPNTRHDSVRYLLADYNSVNVIITKCMSDVHHHASQGLYTFLDAEIVKGLGKLCCFSLQSRTHSLIDTKIFKLLFHCVLVKDIVRFMLSDYNSYSWKKKKNKKL